MLWVLITGALWVSGFGKSSQWVTLTFQSYKALLYPKAVKIIIMTVLFKEKINFTSWLSMHIPVWLKYIYKTVLTSLQYMFMLLFFFHAVIFSSVFFNLEKKFLLLITNHSHLMIYCSSVNTELRRDNAVQFSCRSTFSICKSHCSSNLKSELKWIYWNLSFRVSHLQGALPRSCTEFCTCIFFFSLKQIPKIVFHQNL